jgi:hypothetical protein
MKCGTCGQWNSVREECQNDKSYSPLKIETCKNCGSVIDEPTNTKKSKDRLPLYSDMMPSERQVAKFLDSLKLPWLFEFPLFVFDERNRPRVWTPDFFIPKLGIYIEVCGSKDFNYDYREKIYGANNVSIIFLHFYKREKYWRKFLVIRIREIEERRHIAAMRLINDIPAALPEEQEDQRVKSLSP